MSYPPPVYHGDSGEASTWLRPAAQGPELVNPNGGGVRYLATGATTNGRFGLYRYDMGPAPAGPGPHFHRTISESFYVLEGTIRFYAGKGWVDGHPGDFVHVPEGGVHGFRNESGEPASMLLHFAPGAPREAYFEQVLEVAGRSEPERLAFFLEHDTFWVG